MEENHTETWEPINSTPLPPITLSGLVERANCKVPCAIVNASGKAVLPSYCHQTHFREIIDPRIAAKMKLTGWRLAQPFGTGLCWICGDKAWKVMPVNKDQACAIGAVVPNITIFDHLEKPNEKKKRSLNPLIERPTLFHSIIRALVPVHGVVALERAIVNISVPLNVLSSILQMQFQPYRRKLTVCPVQLCKTGWLSISYLLHKEVYVLLSTPLVVLMWTKVEELRKI